MTPGPAVFVGQPDEFRKWLRDNLVGVPHITERTGAAASTVYTWMQNFDDWPEPVITGSYGEPGTLRGPRAQAFWWWPDVENWLDLHGKPEPPQGGVRGSLTGERLERAQAMHAAVDDATGRPRHTIAQIAAEFGVSEITIYRRVVRPARSDSGS